MHPIPVRFLREAITVAFCEEIAPLLEKHYREISHFQDIPLEPAFDHYRNLDAAGAIRLFTAREGDRLVGYSVFFVRHNLHYRSSLQALQDILFIDPEYRRGTLGTRLIKFCDDELKKEKVQAVYHHVKAAHNFGPLLERIGYQLVDLIYARRLDPWE